MASLSLKHEFPFTLKNPDLVKDAGLINGTWTQGKAKSSFDVTSPGTGQYIGTLPDMNKEDVQDALAAADDAFQSFRKTTEYERANLLYKFSGLLRENIDDIVNLIVLENGKTLPEAKAEVNISASYIDWFAQEAIRNYGDIVPSQQPNTQIMVIKQPVGVCSIMAPWNFPVSMIARKLAPAIAAGCSSVIKPASETPYSAMAMVSLAEKAGIPKGVINFVLTHHNVSEVGKELCQNERVRHVTFTGSTRVGKILLEQASQSVARVSMELGGNAPFIVFDDADLDKAVKGCVASKFRQAGQTCVCANRIFVQEGIHDAFVQALTAELANFKAGDPLDASTTFAALVHEQTPDRMASLVDDAVSKGAKIVTGGKKVDRPGNFFEPTILDNAPANATVMNDEIFGPIAPIATFKDEDEVIKRVNAVPVGLAGYFFTKDSSRLWRVASAIETGMVGANTGLITEPALPFGGIKQSGMGREGSKYGLEEYQEIKSVVLNYA